MVKNKKNISTAARTLAIGMVAALVLVGTATGRYQDKNENLTIAMSVALIVLFAIGFVFNYYGWKLHHIFVSLMGFIISGIIGGLIFVALTGLGGGITSESAGVWVVILLIFFFVFGIIGWKLAPKVEKAMILIQAFIIGAIVQPLVIAIILFPGDVPDADRSLINFIWLVSFFIGIIYAWMSWKIYRFYIILILSVFGTIMMSYALQEFIQIAGFMFPLSMTLLLSGILTQYKKKESKDRQISSDEVPKVKRKSIKVLGSIAFTALGLYSLASVSTAPPDFYFWGELHSPMLTYLSWAIFFIFIGALMLYITHVRPNKLDLIAGGLFFVGLLVLKNIDKYLPSSGIPRSMDLYRLLNNLFQYSPRDTLTYLSLSIIISSICVLVISYYIKRKKTQYKMKTDQRVEIPSKEKKQTKSITYEIGDTKIQTQKIEAIKEFKSSKNVELYLISGILLFILFILLATFVGSIIIAVILTGLIVVTYLYFKNKKKST